MGIKQKKTAVIFVLIYLVALSVRLYRLSDVLVYVDEVTWMVKGKEAVYALKSLNLNYFRNAWWESKTDSYAISWPLTISSGVSHILFAGTGKNSLHLFSDIFASRLPIILISSLLGSIIFMFGKKYIGVIPSSLAGLAYALDPIAISLDRWILNDSFLSLFSFLSVMSYVHLVEDKKLSVLPGVFLALAFLTKPHGILVILAWVGLLFVEKGIHAFKLFMLNILSFYLSVSILWPKAWINPITAIPSYLFNQSILVNRGDPIHNFYLGRAVDSPNWTYYLFQLLFRTPEYAVIILLTGIVYFVYKILFKKHKVNASIPSILGYLLFSFVLLSTSSIKGGVRYLLFFYPYIYLSTFYFLRILTIKLRKPVVWILIMLVSLSSVNALNYLPQSYLYYNSIIGGAVNAQRYDLIGLCFGNKSALEYLDKKQLVGLTAILGCPDSGLYHSSRPQTKNILLAKYIILESAYVQQFPNDPKVELVKSYPLLATVYEKSLITARIYERPL